MEIEKFFTDNHHGYSSDFGYMNGEFFHRHVGTKNWTKVKRVSLTPQRVVKLAKLVDSQYSINFEITNKLKQIVEILDVIFYIRSYSKG